MRGSYAGATGGKNAPSPTRDARSVRALVDDQPSSDADFPPLAATRAALASTRMETAAAGGGGGALGESTPPVTLIRDESMCLMTSSRARLCSEAFGVGDDGSVGDPAVAASACRASASAQSNAVVSGIRVDGGTLPETTDGPSCESATACAAGGRASNRTAHETSPGSASESTRACSYKSKIAYAESADRPPATDVIAPGYANAPADGSAWAVSGEGESKAASAADRAESICGGGGGGAPLG